jgi:uncharacterized protein YegJ (DUF2314 family)
MKYFEVVLKGNRFFPETFHFNHIYIEGTTLIGVLENDKDVMNREQIWIPVDNIQYWQRVKLTN